MYTQQMADENKAMLERAKYLLNFYNFHEANRFNTSLVTQIYNCVILSLKVDFPNTKEARIKHRVVKAARELRCKEKTL